MWNNYALTNDGVGVIARQIRESRYQGNQPIPNYFPEFDKGEGIAIEEAVDTVYIYWEVLEDMFWAVEFSYSCPNSGEKIEKNIGHAAKCTRIIRDRFPWLYIIIKGSIVHPWEFWQEQEWAGANCFHGVNSVPIGLAFPDGDNPLGNIEDGAVSGGPVKEKVLAYNAQLGKRFSLPKIFGCGVENVDDVRKYYDIGAYAVSICSLAIRDPNETEKIFREFNE